MGTWNYYTARNGYLYDESGEREVFDGQSRSGEEWEQYFVDNDIRGTVR